MPYQTKPGSNTLLVADTGIKQSQFSTPRTFHRGCRILCGGTNNSKAEQSRQEKILLEEEEILFHKRRIKIPCKDNQTQETTQERILFLLQPQTWRVNKSIKAPPLRLFSAKPTVELRCSYSFSAAASVGVPSAAVGFRSRRDLESVTIATPVKISAAATACVAVSTARPSRMLTKAATMGCT